MSRKDHKDRQFKDLGSQESKAKAQQLEVGMGPGRVCQTAGSAACVCAASEVLQETAEGGSRCTAGGAGPAPSTDTPPAMAKVQLPPGTPCLHC